MKTPTQRLDQLLNVLACDDLGFRTKYLAIAVLNSINERNKK